MTTPSKVSFKWRIDPAANYRAAFDGRNTLRFPINSTMPISEVSYPEYYDIGLGTKCDGGCSWCVVPDTMVSTLDGESPIQDVQIGERVTVLSDSGEKELRAVDQLHVRDYCGDLVVITLENGRELRLTPNHKLMTARGWVCACDVTEADDLTVIE